MYCKSLRLYRSDQGLPDIVSEEEQVLHGQLVYISDVLNRIHRLELLYKKWFIRFQDELVQHIHMERYRFGRPFPKL